MLGQGSKATFVALHQSGIICHCERTRRTGLRAGGTGTDIHKHRGAHKHSHTHKQT